MKTAKVKFNIEDGFEAGDCADCPLYSLEGTECYDGEYRSCQLGFDWNKCPIVLEGERDDA